MGNNIKKLFTVILALVLSLNAAASADTLIGMVTDISDEGITLYTDGGIRFAAAKADTAWETDDMPAVGDMVTVLFKRSTDGMIHADTIICHRITGTVSEIVASEGPYLILMPDGENEAVRVNLIDIPLRNVAAGLPVTVYYNGIRTRSIPPQITADYIRGQTFTGTITYITDSGEIGLLKDDGETILLHISPDTILATELEVGIPVSVSVLPQMRLSIPAQYEAQDIFPANGMK